MWIFLLRINWSYVMFIRGFKILYFYVYWFRVYLGWVDDRGKRRSYCYVVERIGGDRK